jgi:hypothetical protein
MHVLTPRVLALDIHPGRIAYCVLEGTARVLDWGVKAFGTGIHEAKISSAAKVTRLITGWQPHALAIRHSAHRRSAQTMRAIERQANSARVPVHSITTEAIRSAFPTERDRYERARVIATELPELAPAIPTKPRAWEREPYQTWFFDAASVGFAYFKQLEVLRP